MSAEAQVVQALTGLLSLGVTVGIAYVSKEVKAHFKSQAVNGAVDGLGKIAQATVADFNQRVVNDAKSAGIFTPQLAQSVKADAIAAVKAQGAPLLKLASGSIGDVDALISSLIEQAVVGDRTLVTHAAALAGVASA